MQGNTECPDAKGIKTEIPLQSRQKNRNTECPDAKGIKTVNLTALVQPRKEILNALMQKGLRLIRQIGQDGGDEILNALMQKGLRRRRSCTRSAMGNTECPDAKGIKTRCACWLARLSEILNALMQKGLRQWLSARPAGQARNTECPDAKGIKTIFRAACSLQAGNTECPDAKGIKTVFPCIFRAACEILNALMQKGLRHLQRG